MICSKLRKTIHFDPYNECCCVHAGDQKETSLTVTRVNSTNVLDEGLRIGEIGRRMNSKVKLVEIGMRQK
jgi:hypothetical protein